MNNKVKILGMHCASCSTRVEKNIKNIPELKEVSVNLATETLTFEAPEEFDLSIIEKAVKELGYTAVIEKKDKKKNLENKNSNSSKKRELESQELAKDNLKLIINLRLILFFMFVLLYISMGVMMGLPIPKIFSPEYNVANFAFLQFVVTLPILYIGREFFINGVPSLIKGYPNMNSLISVGVIASMILGIITQFLINLDPTNIHYAHSLYYESAGVVVALVFLGKSLEKISVNKTKGALKKLLELGAKEAILLIDGVEVNTPIENIKIGDIAIVKPGQKVPTDGAVVFGTTSIDESMLTGESIPVEKNIGDKVTGATINKNGYIQMKVEKIGDDTALSQIIRLIEDAQGRKAPIAKLADTISLYFVPIVILISILSGIVWAVLGKDIYFTANIVISILVIACPCAMGLATPTAIMVGTGVGAQHGILIKGGDTLEIAEKINVVLFDKTGTITYGKPEVTDIIPIHTDLLEKDILSIVGSLEKYSEHPLAASIVERCEKNSIEYFDVEKFSAISGKGITGFINGRNIIVGTEKLIEENYITTLGIKSKLEELYNDGKSVMIATMNREIFAIIAVSDIIKPTSKEAISALKKRNIKVGMITGDHRRIAEAVAKDLELDFVISEVLPQHKAAEVKKLQDELGNIVAMVGDGVNDAPALVQADVGIAMGSGTDVAIESADIVIMNSNLNSVVDAIKLSEKTILNIKQNLFWAYIYNILGIPFAAGVIYALGGPLLNPVIAGFAMAFSSVSVVTNALRLRNALK